eukprot:TRINITY_DN84129_c0_g1_i1.p1 TRINITY_DN84129_c0_g1~~TRINITY_DN84129_c0_g1_i1.p1  ORF type:complete len:258 (-),score=17.65 TRINITY_DN84129_c0_g1_i1:143-916(-)
MELQFFKGRLEYKDPVRLEVPDSWPVSVSCSEVIDGHTSMRMLGLHGHSKLVLCEAPILFRVDQGVCYGSPPEGGWTQLNFQRHADEQNGNSISIFHHEVPEHSCTPREYSWKFVFEIQMQPGNTFVVSKVHISRTNRGLQQSPGQPFSIRQACFGALVGALAAPVVLFFAAGRNPCAFNARTRYHPLTVFGAACIGFLVGGSGDAGRQTEDLLDIPQDAVARSMRESHSRHLDWSQRMSQLNAGMLREQLARQRLQ